MTQSFNIECVQIYCNELMISFTVIHFYSIARDMLDLGSFYFLHWAKSFECLRSRAYDVEVTWHGLQ